MVSDVIVSLSFDFHHFYYFPTFYCKVRLRSVLPLPLLLYSLVVFLISFLFLVFNSLTVICLDVLCFAFIPLLVFVCFVLFFVALAESITSYLSPILENSWSFTFQLFLLLILSLPNCFPKWSHTIHWQCMNDQFLCILTNIFMLSIFFCFSHSNRCVMMSNCDYNFYL